MREKKLRYQRFMGHSERSEIPKPPPLEGFNIAYHGILSNSMEWDEDVLKAFREASDLRTNVTFINSGSQGEQLAVNPGDIHSITLLGSVREASGRVIKPLSVAVNYTTAEALISINDQAIAQANLQRDTGFSQIFFVSMLNYLVKQGLQEVSYQEKMHRAKIAAVNEAVLVFGIGVTAICAALVTKNITESQDLSGVLFSLFGLFASTAVAGLTTQEVIKRNMKKALVQNDPAFFQSRTDEYHATGILAKEMQGRKLLNHVNALIIRYKDPYFVE